MHDSTFDPERRPGGRSSPGEREDAFDGDERIARAGQHVAISTSQEVERSGQEQKRLGYRWLPREA